MDLTYKRATLEDIGITIIKKHFAMALILRI